MHTELYDFGLEIIVFPCNQFNAQEPGSADDIVKFAREKHGARFPIIEKCEVNGENCHPAFKFLRFNSGLNDKNKFEVKEVPWNFTKFLVSADGKKVRYFNPKIEPLRIMPDI